MKKIFLCLVLFLCSCASKVEYNDLHQSITPNSNLLPALTTKVSAPNLRAAFVDIEKNGMKKNERDIIVDDVINIFEREAEENITVGDGERKGYISLRIEYVGNEHSIPLRVASIVTLGLANILGFPSDKYTQTMEVEVEITDKKHAVIKRYREIVTSSVYKALYWGYERKFMINRKLAADNIKQALKLIREKINNDASEIKKKLKS